MMSLHFGSCMPMRRIRTLFRWLFEIWSNHNIIFCHIRLSIYINHDISDEIDGLSRLWCGWKFITDRTRVEMYRNREMINCCLTSFLSGFRSDEFISQRSSLCSKNLDELKFHCFISENTQNEIAIHRLSWENKTMQIQLMLRNG